jgi:hypothetical protein
MASPSLLRKHSALCRALLAVIAAIVMLATVATAADTAAAAPPPKDHWADHSSGCIDRLETFTDVLFLDYYNPDYICYEIRPNAVPQDIVEFRLEDINRRHWRKEMIMPDGQGNEWTIWVDASRRPPRNADQDSLWAGQVHNGQRLRFKKAGVFGIMTDVMLVGGLESLKPGTQVVFRWLRDSDGE